MLPPCRCLFSPFRRFAAIAAACRYSAFAISPFADMPFSLRYQMPLMPLLILPFHAAFAVAISAISPCFRCHFHAFRRHAIFRRFHDFDYCRRFFFLSPCIADYAFIIDFRFLHAISTLRRCRFRRCHFASPPFHADVFRADADAISACHIVSSPAFRFH